MIHEAFYSAHSRALVLQFKIDMAIKDIRKALDDLQEAQTDDDRHEGYAMLTNAANYLEMTPKLVAKRE